MGKKHKNKAAQVQHVSKETGVDVKELERLDQEALAKIDDLVESDDDLLGGDASESPMPDTSDSEPSIEEPTTLPSATVEEDGVQILPSETPKSPPQVETVEGQKDSGGAVLSGPSAGSVVKERILLGTHPITGKPVYSDEQ